MRSDFMELNPNFRCSYETFRLAVKSMNISWAKLGNEECESCYIFQNHNPGHNLEHPDNSCDECQKWVDHLSRAKAARKLYEEHKNILPDSDARHIRVSADLQKVIMLPRLECFKTAIFTQRLVAYNESFVPIGSLTKQEKNNKPLAVLWHNAISGRNQEDITSTFEVFFDENRDCPRFSIWLDNCSAQNKNWCLLTFLVFVVNQSDTTVETVELFYFESGHTFMSADSFHHQVENSFKKCQKVYDFRDLKKAVASANDGRALVRELSYSDFRMWESCRRQTNKNAAHTLPYLSNISYIRAEKGCMKLFYKTSHDKFEPVQVLDFLNRKIIKNGFNKNFAPRRTCAKGISADKKTCIIKQLLPLMPPSRHDFWKNLPVAAAEADEDDVIYS
ncbi:hypothetical protein ILUMI_06693 [Ignelater luminosus]|uniref:DUF7869 domain-containing protein n=1 Tax=Ignelater luminosus TaxID=2038154 RepID=A0A8K0D4U2_IGNLU|nr:hypothetical protein ILUMI_06693 [Ignelater luminosus]